MSTYHSKSVLIALSTLKGQEGKLHNLIEDPISIPSMDDNSDAVTSALAEDESTSTANGVNHVLEESTMTLQEKVDNFMKHGVLDPVEGMPYLSITRKMFSIIDT